MNMQQILQMAELAQKLSTSPVVAELKSSTAFQQFEKQMAPMKDEIFKALSGIVAASQDAEKQTEQEVVQPSVDIDNLITKYESLLNHNFKHANGDTYSLLAITNAASEDQVKFPTTAVYVSLTTSENWSRPLVEFSKKFTLI